jgi:hypothetical protein
MPLPHAILEKWRRRAYYEGSATIGKSERTRSPLTRLSPRRGLVASEAAAPPAAEQRAPNMSAPPCHLIWLPPQSWTEGNPSPKSGDAGRWACLIWIKDCPVGTLSRI